MNYTDVVSIEFHSRLIDDPVVLDRQSNRVVEHVPNMELGVS